MKMFEKLKVGTTWKYPTDDEIKRARKVYDRFEACLKDRYGDDYKENREYVPFEMFLLEDVDLRRLDAFEWEKGVLVRTKDGKIGMTNGWTLVGCNHYRWNVAVLLATGESSLEADEIVKSDIPPEVLEYVKSTLQDRVHGKVDEAFKEGE